MTELYEDSKNIIFTTPLPNLKKIGIREDSRILDLGCGYGRVMKHLHKQGYRNLYGIDISFNLIKRAKEQLPQVEFFIGDIYSLDVNETFDVILICSVLEYIIGKNKREEMLKELYKRLNDNGIIYLEAFIRDDTDLIYLTNSLDGKDYGTFKLNNGLILYHATSEEIDQLFKIFFEKILGKETKFNTWTNVEVNGYISVYQKY